MRVIADIHVHSKYSRATSKALSPEGLIESARIKGVDVIGTGDFTHPDYLKELTEKLIEAPDKTGFFSLKKKQAPSDPVFMLTQEISCIYSHNDKGRRNHLIITTPSFTSLLKIEKKLAAVGNLKADGRPILGISSRDLTELALGVDPLNLVIPAHIWTPWFSTFGSKSGYDSMRECFEDMTDAIFAVETGLSSDPLMNWRIKELDAFSIVSNGDAHSGSKVGREATVFELETVSYTNIVQALKNSSKLDKKNKPHNYIDYTIEFYPEEGKYHYDGHRNCTVRLSPKETREYNEICPVCRKPLTVGVESRVEALATRTEAEAEAYGKAHRPGFKKIIPLEEIIASVLGMHSASSKKVRDQYTELISRGGSEFSMLLDYSKKELGSITSPSLVEAIMRMRDGKVQVHPGYDGVYGTIDIFSPSERKHLQGAQTVLF